MKRLDEVKGSQHFDSSKYLGFLYGQYIRNRYVRARKRLILLDYDGTLVNFSADINAVPPDEELYDILRGLADDEKNMVVIISGRKHSTLEEWFGHMQLELVAEHGVWQKKTGAAWKETIQFEVDWKKQLLPILNVFSDRTPGAFTEEKSHSLAWHYRNTENGLGEFRANELMGNIRYLISDLPLQILSGNKVIEIKSREVDKGKAAQHYINSGDYNFILAIGDDITDEDMFKVTRNNGFTIKVGTNKSAAEFYFNNSREARNLLRNLPSRLLVTKMLDKVVHLIPYPPYSKPAKT
jgi:trehalose 6-phosphate synthase/phosphatase